MPFKPKLEFKRFETMINPEFESITLNGVLYEHSKIDVLCLSKLEDSTVDHWEKNIYSFIRELRNEQNYILVKTSGSTGRPKTIKLSKQTLIQSAQLTAKTLSLKKGDTALLCLPCEFIAGKMMVVRAFVNKLNLVTVEPDSNPLRRVNNKIDFTAMVPLQVVQSMSCQKQKLETVKNLIIGGGRIDQGLEEKLKDFPNRIYATYGMTETATHIALKKITKTKNKYYQCLDSISVELNQEQCLVIKAPHIDSEKIITNDLARIYSDTEFEILGRKDNIINSGGIKLMPEEIEHKISKFLDQRFFITSEKDEKLGEHLVLLIENGKNNLNHLYNLWQNLEEHLDKYEIPKKIDYLKTFKYTKSGKINRSLTKKLYSEKS